ncbi:MAG: hypothetical protein AAF598_11145 [Bacteroidota bacterium]
MSILQIFNLSVLAVKKNVKLALIWFGVSFLMAFVSGLPLNSFLSKTIGSSLESMKLANGFDYTLLTDLLNNYGAGAGILMESTFLMLILFLIFNLFFQAGWMATRAEEFLDDQAENVWPMGARFFLRFLFISLVFTLFQGLWLFICFQLFMRMTGGMNLFLMDSELVITQSLWVFVLLLLLGNTIIRLAGDYTKAHVVNQGKSFSWGLMGSGFKTVFTKIRRVFGLYGLIILSLSVIWGIQQFLTGLVPEESGLAFVLFLIFQAYVFFRIMIRMVHLATVVQLEKMS